MTRSAYQIGVSYDLILQKRRISYQIKPHRPHYLLTQNILFSYVTIICLLVNKTAIFLEIRIFYSADGAKESFKDYLPFYSSVPPACIDLPYATYDQSCHIHLVADALPVLLSPVYTIQPVVEPVVIPV